MLEIREKNAQAGKFVGLRDDKDPRSVVKEDVSPHHHRGRDLCRTKFRRETPVLKFEASHFA